MTDGNGYRDEKGRFTEGNPGGPGRPKFSLLRLIREELENLTDDEKKTIAREYAKRYVRKALEDIDGTAMRDLIDRFDGKPKQSITVNNDLDKEWLDTVREIVDEIKQETEGNTQVRPDTPTEDNNP